MPVSLDREPPESLYGRSGGGFTPNGRVNVRYDCEDYFVPLQVVV
jgi:hypothetical protein